MYTRPAPCSSARLDLSIARHDAQEQNAELPGAPSSLAPPCVASRVELA